MSFQNSLAVLDVGHGNCAVVHDAGAIVVIDAGRRRGLLEFLASESITRIDVVLISHADADHIGGLLAILDNVDIDIGEVRLNTDSVKESELWQDVLWSIEQRRRSRELIFHVGLSVSDSAAFDQENVGIEILGPSPYLAARGPGSTDQEGRRLTHNTISAVIRITWSGEPIALLTGDLDEIGLAHLEAEGVDASAPILVFPHHGGNPGTGDVDSFTQKLYDLVSPSTVLFSIGRNSSHTFPRPDIVARLRGIRSDLRIVCTQLSKHCALSSPDARPGYLSSYAMGAEKGKCCGGTIVIPFENIAAISPNPQAHQEFISQAAPSALCMS